MLHVPHVTEMISNPQYAAPGRQMRSSV